MASPVIQPKQDLPIWLGLVRVCVSVVIALNVIWLASTIASYWSQPYLQDFEQTINRELPTGSSLHAVRSFLQRNKFRYPESLEKFFVDEAVVFANSGKRKLKGRADHLAYRLNAGGQIPNSRIDWLCGCGHGRIEFFFDAQQKLVDVVVSEFMEPL